MSPWFRFQKEFEASIYKSIIPRYPWCIVTGPGLWQVGGPISNSSLLVSVISTLIPTTSNQWYRESMCIYTHVRTEDKREGKVGSTKSRPRQIGNRSLDSIWNATNPVDRVYDNVKRWNDLVSFVVSLTREWYTALVERERERIARGEARNKLHRDKSWGTVRILQQAN